MLRMSVCTSSFQLAKSARHSSTLPAAVQDSTFQSLRSTTPTKLTSSPRRSG
jgi:hypothetical protein